MKTLRLKLSTLASMFLKRTITHIHLFPERLNEVVPSKVIGDLARAMKKNHVNAIPSKHTYYSNTMFGSKLHHPAVLKVLFRDFSMEWRAVNCCVLVGCSSSLHGIPVRKPIE